MIPGNHCSSHRLQQRKIEENHIIIYIVNCTSYNDLQHAYNDLQNNYYYYYYKR